MILKQSVWHKKGIWFLIIFFVAIMKSMMKLIFIYVYGWIGLLLRIALSRDDKIKNTIVMSIRDMITQYFLCHDIIAAKIVAMPVKNVHIVHSWFSAEKRYEREKSNKAYK